MASRDPHDPLHDESAPDTRWSRNNSAEAVPGVMTPLGWHFFGVACETPARRAFGDLGILPYEVVPYPERVDNRMFGAFHGRMTINGTVMRKTMCALPGVSGDDVERDIMGKVTPGLVDDPYPGRVRAVATRLPRMALKGSRESVRIRQEAQAWWERSVGPSGPRGGRDPRALLVESMEMFDRAMYQQASNRMVLQATISPLIEMAEKAGRPDAAASLMSGDAELDEAAVADDLWLVATGSLTLGAFIGRHGYHGPNSGLVDSVSWREDAGPIERLLGAVAQAERPAERRARSRAESARAADEFVAALPRRSRPGARVAIRLAPWGARNIERTKTSFLVALDGGRASARAIGDQLVADGLLEDREDAFLFMPDELLDRSGRDLRETADARRAQRAYHLSVELPKVWVGMPSAVERVAASGDLSVTRVRGSGVSPGVAEGPVKVVLDPAQDVDVELGDVLVAPTTDPSWVSLMTVAGALVVDIGTAASHSAIVARELGVPCVIGTETGTVDLQTGDVVRVDGNAGVVDVLSRV